MDNKSGLRAGAEILRSRQRGKLRKEIYGVAAPPLREVQLRTRWTATEHSVRFKNECARFAERSMALVVGPLYKMRDLFAGATSLAVDSADNTHEIVNAQESVAPSPRQRAAERWAKALRSATGRQLRVDGDADNIFEFIHAQESGASSPRSHAAELCIEQWTKAARLHMDKDKGEKQDQSQNTAPALLPVIDVDEKEQRRRAMMGGGSEGFSTTVSIMQTSGWSTESINWETGPLKRSASIVLMQRRTPC